MNKVQTIEHTMLSLGVIIWGAVLIYFYQHPEFSVYLAAKFHLYVLVGGLAAVVLGVFNLLTIRVHAECGHDHDDDAHDHQHQSDLNPFVALCLLVLPLFFSVSATTHRLSDEYANALSEADLDAKAFSFIDIPPFTLETLEASRSKAADGSFQLSLLELFFTAGDEEQMAVFDGLPVETEGKLRAEPNRNEEGKRMRLYRLFMTCCAADMKAIPLSIEFDEALPEISHHSWVRVRGELFYETIDTVIYPVLRVKHIEEIPAPEGEWGEGLQK